MTSCLARMKIGEERGADVNCYIGIACGGDVSHVHIHVFLVALFVIWRRLFGVTSLDVVRANTFIAENQNMGE